MEKKGNKKIIFVITIIIILVLFLGVLVFLNLDTEKRAETRLKQLSKVFYKYYYEDNSDKKDKDKIKVFLSNYSSTGLTIKLKDMETYIDTKKVENYKDLKKCNAEETKITIYPKSPYGKEDFKVELNLKCK